MSQGWTCFLGQISKKGLFGVRRVSVAALGHEAGRLETADLNSSRFPGDPAQVGPARPPGRRVAEPWGREPGPEPVQLALSPVLSCPVSSFSLDSVARDPRELWRFLTQNLSLPNSTAHALLAAQVDVPEVRRGARQ